MQVVRVAVAPVPEPCLGYADAFEVRLTEPDERTAEEWVRAGLEGAPRVVRRIILFAQRRILGLRLGPLASPDRVLGWSIVSSAPEEIRLEAGSPLLHAAIVGRRVDEHCTRLTTTIRYERRVAARLAWATVAPVHRTVARLLLARAARRPPGVR